MKENSPIKILSFGEIIWDVFPDRARIGGAPLNFAAHAQKSGAQAFLLSCVGADALGVQAKAEIERFGIRCDFVTTDPAHATGACQVTLDENGVPTYNILDDVAYDYICIPSPTDLSFDALAFGTLALRGAHNRAALAALIAQGNFQRIYCDLNLRSPFYDGETIAFCLDRAHILKVSETEFAYVLGASMPYEQGLRALAQAHPNLELILLTCGEEGAYAYQGKEDVLTYAPAKQVEVVSTVGAGDSFGATFLVHYLRGEPISDCLRYATERSAYVVAHEGAIPD